MKLDELLAEYAEALHAAESARAAPTFAEFERRRRSPWRWGLVAAAAVAAIWWTAPRPQTPPAPPAAEARFVPLAENSMLPPPQFVQVIQISVPRERLQALGLDAPAQPGGLVDADVLLGEDGIARAMRVRYTTLTRRQ